MSKRRIPMPPPSRVRPGKRAEPLVEDEELEPCPDCGHTIDHHLHLFLGSAGEPCYCSLCPWIQE